MDASNPITAAVFSAFIKCPTKAHLLAIGEHAPGAYFADIEARIASLYKAAAKRRLRVGAEVAEPIDFGELWRSPDAPADRNDHKLKALAIKKNQIHVVGAPSLTLAAVPIFLDVEGMPDRDSYYLVGLRFESGGKQVERSFWADGLE